LPVSRRFAYVFRFAIIATLTFSPASAQSTTEARAIAKEATIYGFPLVDSYRVQYSYFVDRGSPEFKAPWNQIFNNARVYTPDDKAIQTPNSDTPCSYVGADLRAEPVVLTVPAVENGRYYSLQFIDMYTVNFDYVAERPATEPEAIYSPGRTGKARKPQGSNSVIPGCHCATEAGESLVDIGQSYNVSHSTISRL
jgi:hypothetical protein